METTIRTDAGKRPAKLISTRSFQLRPEHIEFVPGKSMTIPDDTYTIREILDKFSRGQSLDRLYRPESSTYDGAATFDSPDMEKLRDSDFTERDEYKEINKQNIDKNKEKLNFFQKQQKQKSEESGRQRTDDERRTAGVRQDDDDQTGSSNKRRAKPKNERTDDRAPRGRRDSED